MGAFFCFRRCAAMRLSNSAGSDAANTAMPLFRIAPVILCAFVFTVAMGVGPEARRKLPGDRDGTRRAPLCLEAWWGEECAVVPRSVVGRLSHEEWHAECVVELPSVVEANILLEAWFSVEYG